MANLRSPESSTLGMDDVERYIAEHGIDPESQEAYMIRQEAQGEGETRYGKHSGVMDYLRDASQIIDPRKSALPYALAMASLPTIASAFAAAPAAAAAPALTTAVGTGVPASVLGTGAVAGGLGTAPAVAGGVAAGTAAAGTAAASSGAAPALTTAVGTGVPTSVLRQGATHLGRPPAGVASTGSNAMGFRRLAGLTGLQAGLDILGDALAPDDQQRQSFGDTEGPNKPFVDPANTLANSNKLNYSFLNSLSNRPSVNLRSPGTHIPGLPFDVGGYDAKASPLNTGGLQAILNQILAAQKGGKP